MDTDSCIRTNIVKELGQEPVLAHSHIAVEVCRGMVRLSGHVATLIEKRCAAGIAERLAGSGAIINSLKICPPSPIEPTPGGAPASPAGRHGART